MSRGDKRNEKSVVARGNMLVQHCPIQHCPAVTTKVPQRTIILVQDHTLQHFDYLEQMQDLSIM